MELAELMWSGLSALKLPPHGTPVRDASGRAGFITKYSMPAILIEPLFVSDPTQAQWLHAAGNVDRLAAAVVSVIRTFSNGVGTVGLSPGHAFKTSSPADSGAVCVAGDTERDHVEALVQLVAQSLS